ADEDHSDKNADRRERNLDPERGQRRAQKAFLGEQRGQRDAGDGGRKRKRDVEIASNSRRPGKRERTSAHTTNKPMKRLTQAARKARPNDIFKALTVRRLETMLQN